MTTPETFTTALQNLATHKLRTALTMLGMIFGVGAVIAMLSIGAGGEKKALEAIGRLGLRNVIVRAKTVKPDDVAALLVNNWEGAQTRAKTEQNDKPLELFVDNVFNVLLKG